MPKKRQNPAFLTKPTGSAPSTVRSSSSATSSSVHGAAITHSVNDLIRESRRAKGQRPVEAAASASLHPTLRAVLDMPAPVPMTPRTHLRGPARLRRIPGPPPPQSWLVDSQHAQEGSRSVFQQLRWQRARIQQQSSTLPGGHMPKHDSLEHLILKRIAINWSWHAEYDNTYLSTLPIAMRTRLLSYLAVYNEEIHAPNPLPLVFPLETDKAELDAVARLDLTNAIGTWATVKKIEKELLYARETRETNKGHRQTAQDDAVPDSWEDEPPEASANVGPAATITTTHLRFSNLKHLSLAANPASSSAPPSWSALIGLTAHLSGLASLSLAHWPTPTYTPNAAKGRARIVNTAGQSMPAQVFGGTDMYTAFDNNWREAAGILRSLSRSLYCLTWLDLTGCGPWLPALTWDDPEGDLVGADWNGSWRNISTLIVAVGWLPGSLPSNEDELSSTSRSTSSINSTRAIEQLYGTSVNIQQSLLRLAELRLNSAPTTPRTPTSPTDPAPEPPWNIEHERAKQYSRRDIERYKSQQDTAREVTGQIRALRRQGNGRYINFEVGEDLGEAYANV